MLRWGWGLLQLGHRVLYAMRMGRFRGICSGLLQIPIECYRNRKYRNALAWPTLKRFIGLRRHDNLRSRLLVVTQREAGECGSNHS
jgi:hypothetical protein